MAHMMNSKGNSNHPHHQLAAALNITHALSNRDDVLLRQHHALRNHLLLSTMPNFLLKDLLLRREMMMLRNNNNINNYNNNNNTMRMSDHERNRLLPNQITSASITPTPIIPPPSSSSTALSKFGLDMLGFVANNAHTLSTNNFKQQQQQKQHRGKKEQKGNPIIVKNKIDNISEEQKKLVLFAAALNGPFQGNTNSNSDDDGSIVYIEKLHATDVLCGRGGAAYNHPGNIRFRQVINDMKLTYQNTDKKLKKTNVSFAIVDYVCNYGGRFVKKEAGSAGRYFLLTKVEARKKTSQALREQKKIRKIIE